MYAKNGWPLREIKLGYFKGKSTKTSLKLVNEVEI